MEEIPMKIAVLNCQGGVGTTRGYLQYVFHLPRYFLAHSPKPVRRIADFIDEERLDAILLTEMDDGSRRTSGVNYNKLIRERTRMGHHLFFPTFRVGRRVNQGNAIHSVKPLSYISNETLPGTGQPRHLSIARMGRIILCVTHLSLYLDVRTKQIERISEVINRMEGPVILGGDFNITKESEVDLISKSRLQKASSGMTYPSWRPARALDHLFFSGHFRIEKAYVYKKRLFSDHLPLVVELNGPQ